MRNLWRLSLLGALCVALALPFLAQFSLPSDASTGLGVAPSKLDLGVVEGGKDIQRQFTLRSTGDTDIKVSIELFDYAMDDAGTFRFSDPGSEPNSSSAWVTLTPSVITLKAGEIGHVDFKMTVPADASAGGHYSMAVFKFGSPDAQQNQLAIQGSVAVQIITQVAGDIQVSGAVGGFSSVATETATRQSQDPAHTFIGLDTPILHENGPVKFVSRFEVVGNAHINVSARTTICAPHIGNLDCFFFIDSGPYTVLPNGSRTIEAVWEDASPGVYVAFQQIEDSLRTERAPMRTYLIVLPWKSLLIILPLLALAIWALRVLFFPAKKKKTEVIVTPKA